MLHKFGLCRCCEASGAAFHAGKVFAAIRVCHANLPFVVVSIAMADPHVITALVKRRAQLAGDIELAHEALRKLVLDLENLDATILQFDPATLGQKTFGASAT
jgi:hypothetical protein